MKREVELGRLREIAELPEVRELLAADPERARTDRGCLLGSGAVALLSTLVLAALSATLFPPLIVLPVVLVVALVLGLLASRRHPSRAHAPDARVAFVLETSTHLRESQDRSARSRMGVRLCFGDGTRQDVEALGDAAAEINEGAAGIAYLRGPWLMRFHQLEP